MCRYLRLFPFALLFISVASSLAQEASFTPVPISIERIPYNQHERRCSGRFVTHTLDHVTTVPGGDNVRMFEANGSGVAINDLDNDSDLDIVLANHAAMNTILWNEDSLGFRTERMEHGESRAVNIVDVDADGLQDIVFTRTASAPTYWHNLGDGAFQREFLPQIARPLYTLNWADLDQDGDLDLVGATYDAGLLTEFGQEFLVSDDAGVYYYDNRDGQFIPTLLANNAQALALVLVDLNGDDRLDILVGNDFVVPDYVWYRDGEGWVEAPSFDITSHSTMSFDVADINNDGRVEVFSTDMRPYADDPNTLAAWRPIIEAMSDDPHVEGDPQIMANVLQVIDVTDTYRNASSNWGVAATGWSWSGKFGDLDQDGWLDLYVVNGMIEQTTFAHLPDHELVEENQVFRNDGQGRFQRKASWGLSSTESGRGMSMADLDDDGDLDIVVNNLRGAAQLFENQLCEGNSLQVDLFWPSSDNTRAIGAEVVLFTDRSTYRRQIRAASGYLSGDTVRVHFGFSEGTVLERLEVIWPDAEVSFIEELTANTRLTVKRS